MKKRKMKRSLLMMAIIIGVVANLFVFTPKSVSAASYPFVVSPSITASVGENVSIIMDYYPSFKNEELLVNIYSPQNKLIAYANQEFYNYGILSKTYTVYWDTTGLPEGKYKVEIIEKFYSAYEWHEAPTKDYTYITLVDDLYKGVKNEYSSNGEEHLSCTVDGNQNATKNAICTSLTAWKNTKVSKQYLYDNISNTGVYADYEIQLQEMYIGNQANTILQEENEFNKSENDKYQWIFMKYKINNIGTTTIKVKDILGGHVYYKYTGSEMTVSDTATLGDKYEDFYIYNIKLQPRESGIAWIGIYVPRSQGMPYLNVGTEKEPIFLNTNPDYVANRHDIKEIPFKDSSCTETGNIEYYKCNLCGKLFKDEKGTQSITLSETVIEKDEHSYVSRLKKADTNENGKSYTECKYCFKKKGATTYIYRPKTVVLKKQYYYNGKKIQPKIVIKDVKGKIISPSEYKVSYTNNVNPGTGKVTITFKGNHYEGKITKSFKIVLRNTSAITVKNTSGRKMAISWKKTALVSGYQIKYTAGSKTKTVTVSKKYLSKKIPNLSKGKTYKVYIRTYKTVNGKKVYSIWSKARRIKIVR